MCGELVLENLCAASACISTAVRVLLRCNCCSLIVAGVEVTSGSVQCLIPQRL